jgi:hypothetical protein
MAHTENLKVTPIAIEDAWKDIVRIKKEYRQDNNDKHINRGAICRLTVGDHSKWVIVHGRVPDDRIIEMDLSTRLALKVGNGASYDFKLTRISWLRSPWFPWKASDPIFRVPAQISLISFFLGVVALILSIPPTIEWAQKHFRHQSAGSGSSAAPTPGSRARE